MNNLRKALNELIDTDHLRETLDGISTGLVTLDRYIGGWYPKTLIACCGSPNYCIYTLFINLYYQAAKSGQKAILLSEIRTEFQILMRLLMLNTYLDYGQNGELTDKDKWIIKNEMKLENWDSLFIHHLHEITHHDVHNALDSQDFRLIFLEFNQKTMINSSLIDNLRKLAKSHHITILLNLIIPDNNMQPVDLSKLRDLGFDTDQFDMMMSIFYPDYYRISRNNQLQFRVLSNKYGSLYNFNMSYSVKSLIDT